jgi:class 3 adenylate cyclase
MSGRATATVMFTDVVASTATRSHLGEERADQLRRTHDRLLRQEITRHGGQVIKGVGDGLMAAFTSASDALNAAVGCQRAIAAFNQGRDALADLSVRIGVSTGDVSFEGNDVFGLPVVEAARLEASAEGGQILCSELVKLLAHGRDGHDVVPIGLLELNGIPQPLATCEVRWRPTISTGPEIPLPYEVAAEEPSAFVGRRDDIDRGLGSIFEPHRTRAAVLWIAGEPGIGKTRLAIELARRAYDGGATVLFGRCNEDLGVPYQPFVEALRWFIAHQSDRDLGEQLGPGGGGLAHLAPELAARINVRQAALQVPPEAEKYRLFEAVRGWLSSASRTRPLVLIVDDVHWATEPTRQLLLHLARSSEPSRVTFVCTSRNTEPDESDAVRVLRTELQHRAIGESIELGGLSLADVAVLVRDEELAPRVHAETAGNPLFVRAAMSAVVEAGRPASVTGVVAARMSRLPESVRQLLTAASICGLEFDLRVSGRACGLAPPADLVAAEGAIAAGLVREQAPNLYRFAHGLVRNALRDGLSATRRAHLHRDVGRAIEQVRGGTPGEHTSELAHHFWEALPAGEHAKARVYAQQAAEQARRVFAYRDAAILFDRAAQLEAEPASRASLHLASGEAWRRANEFDAALPHLMEAIDLAVSTSLGRLALDALFELEQVSWRAAQWGDEILTAARRVELVLDPSDRPAASLLDAIRGQGLLYVGYRREAREVGDRAIATARASGDARVLGWALTLSAFALLNTPEISELDRRMDELFGLADELGDMELISGSRHCKLAADVVLARLDLAEGDFAAYQAAASEQHDNWSRFNIDGYRVFQALRAGDLARAEALIEQANVVEDGWSTPEGLYGLHMFLLRREQDRLGEVAPALNLLLRLRPAEAMWRPGLALLHAELGDRSAAAAELDRVAGDEFAAVADDGHRALNLAFLAEVCWLVGDSARAAQLEAKLAPYAGLNLFFVGSNVWLGPADRYLGLLAATRRDYAAAAERLGAAADLCRLMHAPLWLARCLCDLAEIQGDPLPAREAALLADRFALPALRRRATDLLAGRPRVPISR